MLAFKFEHSLFFSEAWLLLRFQLFLFLVQMHQFNWFITLTMHQLILFPKESMSMIKF